MSELVDVLVELGGHAGDLGLRQSVDAQGLDELVHSAGGHPGEVAVRDHGDQGGLGSFAALQEPFGGLGAGAQFRDGDVDGADAGVEGAVAVAVALRESVGRGLALFGSADLVGVGGQEGVDQGLQQGAHHVGRGLGQQVAQHVGGVDNVWSGHRGDVLSREL